MSLPMPLGITIATLLGLIMGSFLNVVIHRLPLGESIVRPRSHCLGCLRTIPWYQNIPIISYLLLRGKCSQCGRHIPLRYLVVEVVTTVLSILIWLRFPLIETYVAFFLLLSCPLLAITFIDLENFLIPDVISLPGILLGLGVHLVLGEGAWSVLLIQSLLGIVAGGGALFVLSWLYERMRGQVGLGMGDVKLAAMLGAFFGWRPIVFILLFSSLVGTLIGIFVVIFSRKGLKQAIPYGPFLALGAWSYLFYGPQLIHWYLNLTTRMFTH